MKYTAALVLVTISMVYGGGIGLVGPASLGASLVGPSARSTIVGPDGSAISSATDGGALLAASGLGGAISAAPGLVLGGGARVIAAPGAWADQGVWAASGAWARQEAWAAPGAWDASGAGLGRLSSVIQGPSGIIATNGNPWGAINGRSVGIVQSVGSLGLGLENGVWRR